MPVKIPDTLPAMAILESENIFVMGEDRAQHQDIRPLRIAILNLMPTKIVTETQLLRLLGNSPLQVEIDAAAHRLARVEEHAGRAPDRALLHLSRGPRPEVRRPDHHRRAGRAPGVRGGGLLARAGRDPGLGEQQRLLDAAHLLGRAGRAVPPLRRSEVSAAGEDVRRLPAPRAASPNEHCCAASTTSSTRRTRATPRSAARTSGRCPSW